eukprot:UN03873
MIWYTETICPGNPRLVLESWIYPQYRLKWDSFIASSNKIMMDEHRYPNTFILHTEAKPAAGGIISPRDFVDLLNIYEVKDDNDKCMTVQIASKSIKRNDIPEKKGFVRGVVVLSGVLFDRLGENDLAEYKLPKLVVQEAVNVAANVGDEEKESEVGWTRLRYIC